VTMCVATVAIMPTIPTTPEESRFTTGITVSPGR
jgi:hypothetical protein